MYILVDYDNLTDADRRKGVVYVVEKILATLGSVHLSSTQRLHVRLYSGWYDQNRLTRLAQKTISEIQPAYPGIWSLSSSKRIPLAVDLALSLIVDPYTHIGYTYRQKSAPWNLKCHHPHDAGCNDGSSCVLLPIHSLLTKDRCPQPSCAVRKNNLLYRSEQKLVDAMVAADLFHLAITSESDLCIVTSDHDVWPAAKVVLGLGRRLVILSCKPGQSLPVHYTIGIGTNCIQLSF